jgi:CBS domain containing-hemolysin-like protein
MNDIGARSLRERAASEFREFCIIAIYLFVCFGSVAYLKFAILKAEGVAFAPFGFAAAKALISAKFVMLGHAFHLGERFKKQALIWPVLHRSMVFLLLLLALNALEEIIVGWMHGHALADTLAEIGGGTRDQQIATAIIMLLILIPFFLIRVLGEVIGERTLFRLFFEPRRARKEISF